MAPGVHAQQPSGHEQEDTMTAYLMAMLFVTPWAVLEILGVLR